jgi:1-acyl-sn-glycerol-3-phosphate acyltransferase
VFDKPCIIISNHSSFIDILMTVLLSPNLILLTNKWVWTSPVFGFVVRLGEYYPVEEGAEDAVERLKKKIDQGFSILIFPEGTRSPDGKVKRFHKGAFYLAEKLKVDIRPLLLHGTHETIVKGDFYVNNSSVTLKFLPPIAPNDERFGVTYSERTKAISKYFKNEFLALAREKETPDFFYYKLMRNYYYKGPVLEWYARIKLMLEKNYAKFHALVPAQARVLDLGCGYGFMSYMLHFLSNERIITGVDYDQQKIDTATNCYSKTEKISFFCDDVMQFPVEGYDVIIISDVLHYLTPGQQAELLEKCFAGINKGGRIIIRDGNAEMVKQHRWTKLTEFFSTKLVRFNKSVQELTFIDGQTIKNKASRYNLSVETDSDSKLTSNVIFVVKSA